DHHHHQSRQAGRHRQHADHQRSGSGHHRREPRPGAPGGRGRRHRHPAHHEPLLVLRPPLRGRLRRGRDDPGAQGVPGAPRHDFHRRLSAAGASPRAVVGAAFLTLVTASFDGGAAWTLANAACSRCTGGNSGNPGDYARATDVWLTVSPAGVVYALSLSFSGATLLPGSSSGMLVAQSRDGGLTWSAPIALIQDGSTAFNDKGSITADSTDANYVYAVWDRLSGQSAGPSYFAVTANAGSTWQAARSIYDPGAQSQTLGNQIVVLPGDVVLDLLTELGATSALVRVIRSTDHGANWSAALTLSDLQAVGTTDPNTGAAVRDGSGLVSVSVGPGGIVYVAWQDSRFSGGQHDGIAMTHSADGGLTWSVPVQVNADPNVPAFTPTIHVRADGVIGVTYYDLRSNTSSPASLLADCWLVTSSDGVTFRESHLSGPFDLDLAPDSRGQFLGDYEALASTPSSFLPFYVQTDAGAQVRSDAFIDFP